MPKNLARVYSCFPPLPDNQGGPTSLLRYFLQSLNEIGFEFEFIYQPLAKYLLNPTNTEVVKREIEDLGGKFFNDTSRVDRKTAKNLLVNKLLLAEAASSLNSQIDENNAYHIKYDKLINIYYPFWYSHLLQKASFDNMAMRNIVICMDSSSLLHFRRFVVLSDEKKILHAAFQLLRFARAVIYEKLFLANNKSIELWVVGHKDKKIHELLGSKCVHYIPHPLRKDGHIPNRIAAHMSQYKTNCINIYFHKIDDSFYGSRLYIKWIKIINKVCRDKDICAKLTMHHCSDRTCKTIRNYMTDKISLENPSYVSDFQKLLSNMNIAAFPLRIGAGTKNSVLEAINAGLIVIGTEVALENIVYHGNVFNTRSGTNDTIVESAFTSAISLMQTEYIIESTRLSEEHNINSFNAFVSTLMREEYHGN